MCEFYLVHNHWVEMMSVLELVRDEHDDHDPPEFREFEPPNSFDSQTRKSSYRGEFELFYGKTSFEGWN